MSAVVARILYGIGELQWLAKTSRDLAERAQVRSATDVAIAHALFVLAGLPLNDQADRLAVAKLYQQHRADQDAFIADASRGEHDELIAAAVAWLASCTPTCAFERTLVHGLLCELHSSVLTLRYVAEEADRVSKGLTQRELSGEEAILKEIRDQG